MVKNRRGSALVFYLMAFFVFFFMVSPVFLDFMNTVRVQNRIKTVSDIAVKSASFKIQRGQDLADGKFHIDKQEAIDTILTLFQENFSLTNENGATVTAHPVLGPSDKTGVIKIENSTNTTGNPVQSMSIDVYFYTEADFVTEAGKVSKKLPIWEFAQEDDFPSWVDQEIDFDSGGAIALEVDVSVRTFFGSKLYKVVSFSTSRLDSIYNIP